MVEAAIEAPVNRTIEPEADAAADATSSGEAPASVTPSSAASASGPFRMEDLNVLTILMLTVPEPICWQDHR